LTTRETELKLIINPRAKTYKGPVAILVDGLSASTSEFLAGGLQDIGRVRIFGTRTVGAALPSMIEKLPNGDGFQYVFGHYVSASGKALEANGVTPDQEVTHTREALLAGRDLMLEAAIDWIEWSKAAEILDKHVEVTGGLENYNKINNRYMEATFSMPAAGLDFKLKMWAAKPNKLYTSLSSEAVGNIERGTDGDIFWEKSLMTGPRIMEGSELVEHKLEAYFDRFAYWRDIYEELFFAGEDSLDATLCHKVLATTKSGKEETLLFDANSNLLLKISSVVEHQMGKIPVEVVLDDYREVDGLKMAFVTRAVQAGQAFNVVMDSVAHNVELPEGVFVVPDDILELKESSDTTKSE
jgi:hypothetical protein